MKKIIKQVKIIPIAFMLIFGVLLITNPESCKQSVAEAIIICARVIIPSLFPFGVCMLFILKSDMAGHINPVWLIFLFSLLGGYPMGAKLINEAVKSRTLTLSDGRKMLCFCVNGGPAFIMSAVGVGLLKNREIGIILLLSHILASVIIFFFSGKIKTEKAENKQHIALADNLVISASDSASAVISICFFVILFSVLTGYIEAYCEHLSILKPLVYLTEITLAVTKTRNIVFISFLLGFAGFCIWAQVLAVGKDIKISLPLFAFFRILHGLLSALLTFLALKIFPIETPVFSNGIKVSFKPFVSGGSLGISLVILGLIFIISLSRKRENVKILEELI